MNEPTPQDPGARPGAGHPRVDEVLDALTVLDDLPPAEHVRVYEAAHSALREALAGPVEA